MFCKACGEKIADNSRFCNVCGAPQDQGAAAHPRAIQVCRIVMGGEEHAVGAWINTFTGLGGGYMAWWEARVNDDVIKRTDSFRWGVSTASRRDYDKNGILKAQLVEQLIGEGWEPIIQENGDVDALKRMRP